MPDPSALAANPFASLTVVAGPAVLTNACSVLALGTSNRLARVVDRTRVVTHDMAKLSPGTAEYEQHARQRQRLAVRSHLLLRALRAIYTALGGFASAALLMVVASILELSAQLPVYKPVAAIALIAGVGAVVGLVYGCSLMVRETRLAVQYLEEEAPI
jgi:VIT1/CCC1 family predicted Fe2+/Mn2+ transporter